MFLFAHIDSITLPLEDPILKFLLILVIILAAPLLLNKLKIPYLLGLIIAGAVIGPHGLNLVLRDSSIILSGTAGLLYIMFLSGLDMDMSDFKKNSWRSLIFGLYTFCVPLGLGILAGYYILGFPIYSSILLAGLFASQTLIAYPIVSKLGISRDKAVTIAVGGTVITDTLALLLLTVIVGMATGNVDETFWWRLSASVLLSIGIILFLFPLLAHWFFKHCSDSVSQYIFVLAMVFLGAYLAHMAGLEPIIGAFLSGLALNRQIPRTSPLMNRIEFVGNAIFIPFFLIGVGMLIDYRAFFRDWESIEVAMVMIALITLAKFLAAYFTQKTFRLSNDQRTVIFGLSSAHVAATLAAVMVGYNVILGAYGGRRTDPPAERKRPERHDPDDPRHLHRLDLRHATGRAQHRHAQCAGRRQGAAGGRPYPDPARQRADRLRTGLPEHDAQKGQGAERAVCAERHRQQGRRPQPRKTGAQTARHGGAGGGIGRQLHAATAPLRREHRQRHRQRGQGAQYLRHRDGYAPRPYTGRVGHRQDGRPTCWATATSPRSSTIPNNRSPPSSGTWSSCPRKPRKKPGSSSGCRNYATWPRIRVPGSSSTPRPARCNTCGLRAENARRKPNTWFPTAGTT